MDIMGNQATWESEESRWELASFDTLLPSKLLILHSSLLCRENLENQVTMD